MNNNLLERINLLEGVKDELINRIKVERHKREIARSNLRRYEHDRIYIAYDTEHCIDMIGKYRRELELHSARVIKLFAELQHIEDEIFVLREEYDRLNLLDFIHEYYI